MINPFLIMSNSEPKKVVYLLGTGVSHAEKYLESKIKNTGINGAGILTEGLISKDVSLRVIHKLLNDKPDVLSEYGISNETFYTPWGEKNVDIELFISMLDMIRSETTERHARILRKYYRDDIRDNLLVNGEKITPRLLPSLIEWHNLEESNEKLLGFLTLNYDSMLETALSITNQKFDYGIEDIQLEDSINFPYEPGNPHVLKLHGSFDWFLDSEKTNKIIVKSEGPVEAMQWIPPQLSKGHQSFPFNTIYEKTESILKQCDILRVIGCSLSLNDMHLISLLFKTQLSRRPTTYSIDIIDSEDRLKELVKDRLGILLSFEESFYRKNDWTKFERDSTYNNFLDWLYFKINNTLINDISSTDYIKNINSWSSR